MSLNDDANIDAVLSTTGIYTCIAILIILNDNRVFTFHSDPSYINSENKGHMDYEVQKLVKYSISMFKEYEDKHGSWFESISIIAGLNNELNRMQAIHSSLTSMIDELDDNDLQNFVKCIIYSNAVSIWILVTQMVLQGNALISDTTILVDLTV